MGLFTLQRGLWASQDLPEASAIPAPVKVSALLLVPYLVPYSTQWPSSMLGTADLKGHNWEVWPIWVRAGGSWGTRVTEPGLLSTLSHVRFLASPVDSEAKPYQSVA